MSDAPERITAYKEGCFGLECINLATWEPFGSETYNDGTEYVRADIHAALEAERDALREALTPSGDTKAAYMGEVNCDCSMPIPEHYVPWTSIKTIMKMIAARAALKGHTNG